MDLFEQNNLLCPDVLENRYKKNRCGGAFDAKKIKKPRSLKKIEEESTFGRKVEDSIMLEGLNTENYSKSLIYTGPSVSNFSKPSSKYSGTPGIPIPKTPNLSSPIAPTGGILLPQPPTIPPTIYVWSDNPNFWGIDNNLWSNS